MNKGKITGQIGTGLILGVAGIIASTMLGLFSYALLANNKTDSQLQEVKKDLSVKGERIASVEEAIKRIPIIEAKIDALLLKGGIKFESK